MDAADALHDHAAVSPPARSLSPWIALLRKERYRKHFVDADRKQSALVTAVITVAILAVAPNDFLLLHGTALHVTLAGRVLNTVAAAVSLVLLRRARWPRQHDRANAVALVTTAVAMLQAVLMRFPTGEAQGPAFGCTTVVCVLYFAHRSALWQRLLVCVTTSPAVLVLLWNPHADISPVARLTATLSIVGLNVVGYFSVRAFEKNRQRLFEAERELRRNLAKLAVEKERAEAMSRARTAFLAAMSHEFRTPMNAVIGLSDLLLDEPLALDHRAHVRTISDSARALLGLLEDILDFAKIDAQKLTLAAAPFDFGRLTRSVADMLRPAATNRLLDLAVDVAPGVPASLVGDEARLRQVLVNLVANAVKFTERGAVVLRIAARAREGRAHEITFRVEDTGIGMSPEVLARIFRPFEQADAGSARRHGGTGLGLAISQQIVVAMGGELQVESTPGRGSVFWFTVPLGAAAAPERATPAPAYAPAGGRAPLAVLVVDDHPVNREVARAKLARLGYAVDLATGGVEAVEAVGRKNYDVVLMDLHMPGMSGIEATARFAEALADRRAPEVVAMTASVFEEDREACRRAGMRDFVGKPVDLAELSAVLVRIAAERGAAPVPLSGNALARLRQIEGLGEPGFFQELCRIFLTETHKRLPRMRAALARGEVQEVAREAHPLRSASASLGALELSEVCARIEREARAGRVEGLEAGLDAVAAQLAEVERALAQEVRGEAA